jgi:hypothetical protein
MAMTGPFALVQQFGAVGKKQSLVCQVRDSGVPAVAGGAAHRPRAKRDAEPPRRVTRRPAFTDAERNGTPAAASAHPRNGVE